jgi:hypothetical protein
MKTKLFYLFIIAFTYSCNNDSVVLDSTNSIEAKTSRFMELKIENYSLDLSKNKSASSKNASSAVQLMNDINSALKNQGISVQLNMMEYYSSDGAGNTVFFNNRGSRQLTADFVPRDPRRGGYTEIGYAYDGTEGATASGLTQEQTNGAIERAMNTWDNVACSSGLELFNLGASPFDLGYVQALVTNEAQGSFFYTDVMHSGFGTDVIDVVFGPESDVLGVTFTFIWLDDLTDEPTDIDNNNKDDVAFRDIYYNDAFPWNIGANIDVETVALHESGHGLSQAHFGKAFRSGGNSKLHFSPIAVMNAGYSGIQQSIGTSDKAGHCSIWSQWPYN